MDRLDNNTRTAKGKHLNYEKRIRIEALSKAGLKTGAIAKQIGCSERTIRRELAKGRVELLNSDLTVRYEYSADVGQQKHEYAGTGKGPCLKIGKEYELAAFIEAEIKEAKKSPYAVAEEIKKDGRFQITISYKTIYNYIDMGLFPNLTNKDLPVKKSGKKRNYNHVRTAANNSKGTSISERPAEVEERAEFGHWEMDTVVGKSGTKDCLLVLTERKGLHEIIRKMPSKSQCCVVKELDKIERQLGTEKFKEIFKTITCDNGCEFLNYEGMEQSAVSVGVRTKVYYAHPFSAWERGSNENANKLIRRFIPKGSDIAEFSPERIQLIEVWINNYPRRRLGGKSSLDLFQLPLVA